MYPFQLRRAILAGFRNQLREDERHFVWLCGILPGPDAHMTNAQLERRARRILHAEHDGEESDEERAQSPSAGLDYAGEDGRSRPAGLDSAGNDDRVGLLDEAGVSI